MDEVADQIEARRPRWLASGLAVGLVTWRDRAALWPRPLETDRSSVVDPDSVGVRIVGPAESELSVVVFRGGWADVDYLIDEHITSEAPDVPSGQAAGRLLDDLVARIWGPVTSATD